MKEVWKPIPGWARYYHVSNLGRVKNIRKDRILKVGTPKSKWSYPRVGLNANGKTKCRSVHRLVLLAFVGKPPKGYECCHNNGVKTDNRLLNLRWGTSRENALDSIKHRKLKGEKQC